MRRILVENARRRQSVKHGAQHSRIDLDEALPVDNETQQDLLELDKHQERLLIADPWAAEVVKLLFFAGLTGDEAAGTAGASIRFARAKSLELHSLTPRFLRVNVKRQMDGRIFTVFPIFPILPFLEL